MTADPTVTFDIEVRLVEPDRVSTWVTRWRDFTSIEAAAAFLARLDDGSAYKGRFAIGQPWQKQVVQVARTVVDPAALTSGTVDDVA